ncbi:MAG: 3-hydroxyacyl-CoA dehydrogenase [Fulvivirga sp.]|nr:3-hydroxyacyl-CoA dehydrogenase [Fulvivirga sp.]
MNNINKVLVAGGGTLGSQISWQVAFSGFEVNVYDLFDEGITHCKRNHEQFARIFKKHRNASDEQLTTAKARIHFFTNLEEAVNNVDLVSESVPEELETKLQFYQQLSKHAPSKTIFTTNSSTMVPSQMLSAIDRPAKFLALHFANGIWEANVGEVMGHKQTDAGIFNQVMAFAQDIGMVPIPIYKEQNGYILNSLLIPFIQSAEKLLIEGVSDFASIDKTWMIATNMKMGPFGIMDMIGMRTIYNVHKMMLHKTGDEKAKKMATFIKKEMIDKGKMGMSTGEGFYKYPNPAYEHPEFTK